MANDLNLSDIGEALRALEVQKRRQQMQHMTPQAHDRVSLQDMGKQFGLGYAAGVPGYVAELANLVRQGPGLPMTSPMRRIKQQAPQTTKWIGERMGADVSSPAFTLGSFGSPDMGDLGKLGVIMGGHISPKLAKTLGYKTRLPNDDVFKSAVANTPGAEFADDGLILRTVRRQRPEQEGALAVRGGVFYLPEKSKDLRHYKGRTSQWYGGSEQFSGETMIRAPLVVKGATGGQAPKKAYDMIMGKGAYDAMRGDALDMSVTGFLEKYAPEMVNYGDEIMRVSGRGNQLPYALQEAAVAHAVRQAGYDSVLGYSMKRTGEPFLSELFDVRELTYPARNIDPMLHEAFK